jgi:hypothetical protein
MSVGPTLLVCNVKASKTTSSILSVQWQVLSLVYLFNYLTCVRLRCFSRHRIASQVSWKCRRFPFTSQIPVECSIKQATSGLWPPVARVPTLGENQRLVDRRKNRNGAQSGSHISSRLRRLASSLCGTCSSSMLTSKSSDQRVIIAKG